MNRHLLIGGTGFVGKHYAQLIQKNFFLTGRNYDVRNINILKSLIASFKPTHIVYLASISTLDASNNDPKLNYEINVNGIQNLLKILTEISFSGKLLYVSSGQVYGEVPYCELPIDENYETIGTNPYALAKIAAEHLCLSFVKTSKFKIFIARPFNHIGPDQSADFAISNFCKQVILMKYKKISKILNVGNINIKRDFLDVRDVCGAYDLILNKSENGEIYNVCSGYPLSLKKIIDQISLISNIDFQINIDEKKVRKNEIHTMYGDCKKIIKKLGWKKNFSIDQSIVEILDFWERQLLTTNDFKIKDGYF